MGLFSWVKDCLGLREKPRHTRRISQPVFKSTTANLERMGIKSQGNSSGDAARVPSIPADVEAEIADFLRPQRTSTPPAPEATTTGDAIELGPVSFSRPAAKLQRKWSFEPGQDVI